MKKFEACTSCGSTASLHGSNFCSNCGAGLSNTNSEEPSVPMVSAIPVEANATAPIQAVAVDEYTAASSSDAPVPSVEYQAAQGTRNRTNDPFVASEITFNTEAEFSSALYWKNPSPAMLERASNKALGGVLFLETGGLSGKFTLPESINLGQVLNGKKIDLSYADFVHSVTTITMGSVLGSVSITVPRGVRVESEGFAILGSFGGLTDGQTVHAGQVEDSPLLVIKGVTILGRVSVTVNKTAPAIRVIP